MTGKCFAKRLALPVLESLGKKINENTKTNNLAATALNIGFQQEMRPSGDKDPKKGPETRTLAWSCLWTSTQSCPGTAPGYHAPEKERVPQSDIR